MMTGLEMFLGVIILDCSRILLQAALKIIKLKYGKENLRKMYGKRRKKLTFNSLLGKLAGVLLEIF